MQITTILSLIYKLEKLLYHTVSCLSVLASSIAAAYVASALTAQKTALRVRILLREVFTGLVPSNGPGMC
jgi:hypothetical protein